MLISFVVLVQFASFLGDLQERSRREEPGPSPPLWRAFLSNPRRLVEVLADFAIICVSFLTAYLLFVDGGGTVTQRALFLATLPVLLGVRYVLFVVFGIYRRIWRFASRARPARNRRRGRPSVPVTIGIVAIPPVPRLPARDLLRRRAALRDARAASRLVLRLLPGLFARVAAPPERTSSSSAPAARAERSRASSARHRKPGRRLPGRQPGSRRRRMQGVKVLGALDEIEGLLVARPDPRCS